jgi:hypothetical protein
MGVISIPSYPPAPDSLEISIVNPTAMTRSPFSGAQQIFNWAVVAGGQSFWLEATITLPILIDSDAENWFAFLTLLKGPTNTFQFTSAFVSAYPWLLQGGSPITSLFWRLKSGTMKMSLSHQRVFGLNFDCLQAL